MAVPCSFDESNHVLGAPEGWTSEQCESLSVCITENANNVPVVVSCFKITKEELEEFQRTGRIWLIAVGNTMPPVAVTTVNPFDDQSE